MTNIKTLVDYNRKDVTTYGGQVKPVIPEHFTEQYPDLVKFLEAYYEYLDSDGQFGNRINSRSFIWVNNKRLRFRFSISDTTTATSG